LYVFYVISKQLFAWFVCLIFIQSAVLFIFSLCCTRNLKLKLCMNGFYQLVLLSFWWFFCSSSILIVFHAQI